MGHLMRKDIVERLNEVVKSIESSAEVTAACGRQSATRLLQMARLDLLCEIHEITNAELQAFASELGRKRPARKESVVYLAERKGARGSCG
jgi:hypothetical protein